MGCKRTDCIEKPLSQVFQSLGRLVGSHPVWFLVVPLIVSACLGGGLYFLKDREDNDVERQFTPKNGPSKISRGFVRDSFPQDTSSFSGQRLYSEGLFASIIVVSNKGSNILTREAFEDIINLNNRVNNISAQVNQKEWKYSNLCSKTDGHCVPNDILEIINYDARRIEQINISYPMHVRNSKPIFLGSTLGGVEDTADGVVQSAKAVKLMYFLENQEPSDVWLEEFQRLLSGELGSINIKVSYFTSRSRQEEIEKHTTDGIPLFSITYGLAIGFSVLSNLRLDNVRNKLWVAAVGVLSAGLAVLSSFGLMLYIGMPFVITVANSPFLILGIGVDDMFIMVSNWQRTPVRDPVPTRMARTYREAAMSITITTLTDVLGFCIGLTSHFPSVQMFCLYTSTAVLFCYLYNITFFGAFLALNGRREAANRHWLTCMEVPPRRSEESCSGYSVFCMGGDFDKDTGTEKEQPMNRFFKKYYGPLMTKPWTKAVVVLMYGGYLAVSVFGCFNLQQGIDLRDLAADDSYVITYYDNDRAYFSHYGPNVMVIVTEQFSYWDQRKRFELSSCMEEFRCLRFIERDLYTSWLDSYEAYGRETKLNLDDEHVFLSNLSSFLSEFPDFKQDVNITGGLVRASRFFIQTRNIANASMEIEMFNSLKDTVKRCTTVPLMVYHLAFIYYDQYEVIVSGTLQNIGVTTAIMMVVSLLLIPNPLCSLGVTLSIASVIVGVAGFMALWGVNLDSVSMIILVVCIGFTVDFSAHICYSFVSSTKQSVDERVVDALFTLGYPIIQGAASTILGVVVLAGSKNHIFRTFFKIMFLVMVFGLVHGVTFLPVFLGMASCCWHDNKSAGTQKGNGWISQHSSNKVNEIKPHNKNVSYDNKACTTNHICYQLSIVSTQHTHVCGTINNHSKAFSTSNWGTDPDCP